jgi:hypothetical protein
MYIVFVKSQTVTCIQIQNGVEAIVSDSSCTASKPLSSQVCNAQTCTDGKYIYGPWSGCSVSCNGGTQTRTQQCVDATGAVVADSRCMQQTALPTSQSCSTDLCPQYGWVVGTFSQCSASCNGGIQTRTTQCEDSTHPGVAVNSNYCTLTQPATIQNCNVQACVPPPTYAWVSSDWDACTATCGGGLTSRSVVCKNTVDMSVAASESSCTSPKPTTQQACNQQVTYTGIY